MKKVSDIFLKRSTVADSYEDIIDLPRPALSRHPRMSMESRAMQFAPFSALTGRTPQDDHLPDPVDDDLYPDSLDDLYTAPLADHCTDSPDEL